ncbi:xanthine dehydrogenase family protein molybdopterin-binding subunit [Bradyrhizobium sp.]|uniref:xanthine dehydrogenase family protein molybdopterin-binding subunit n=1 Tax=Bradyrhizobium sp. TaxID=376 RepID=UPI0025B835FA|nr:xanthine dehydrogenase family protein molybdopterin-binding subunit [Bradyrhizobium sp.]MBV8918051.1 xanthine dehydrogenase family protein molybdopterin-binding subunit [Bradyrhizobium sp.]
MSLGDPIPRRDGPLKVAGRATYAADQHPQGIAYAAPVLSTIASGEVLSIDTRPAMQRAGVLTVLTPDNMPALGQLTDLKGGTLGEPRLPLSDRLVEYDGQLVGLVVAESLELANEAAALVQIVYAPGTPRSEIERSSDRFRPKDFYGIAELQTQRGDVDEALSASPFRLQHSYETSVEHHNPMEPHATTALWEGDRLIVYDSTQGVISTRNVLAHFFGLPAGNVRVICPYVGGGFGSKGYVWPRTILAAAAAKATGRPVKLALSRQATFSNNGHRGRTIQTVSLGADQLGRLIAIRHHTLTQTSLAGVHVEPSGIATGMLYACDNVAVSHEVARVTTGSPTAMRAPGEASGVYALECAMDELAEAIGMDPLELRRRNHAVSDPETGKPFSSKHLLACYERGAQAFGWSRRDPRPRSMTANGMLIGWGMASATYPANMRPSSARVEAEPDGRFVVTAATQDLGTGAYTILAQIAAAALGVPVEKVRCELGDSALPEATLSGGSSTSASVGSAVHEAALKLRTQLSAGGAPMAEAHHEPGELEKQYSAHSFGAHFVEVAVDPELAVIRVRRVVSAMDVGRILNHRTAQSQIRGGVVWGIGMALMERTGFDPATGRLVTRNLADYLVPVNPDVPEIQVILIDEPDPHFGPIGARGMGEIGITGLPAVIANAVWHATGVRVRRLPIVIESILHQL